MVTSFSASAMVQCRGSRQPHLGLARLLALSFSGGHLGLLALQLRRLLRQGALSLCARLLCLGPALLLAAGYTLQSCTISWHGV